MFIHHVAALHITKLALRPEFLPETVQHGHKVEALGRVAAAPRVVVVGQRTGDEDGAQVLAQRQQAAFVFEQDNRLARRAGGDGEMLRCAHDAVGRGGIGDVGLVEEAEPVFHPEDVAHSRVDDVH